MTSSSAWKEKIVLFVVPNLHMPCCQKYVSFEKEKKCVDNTVHWSGSGSRKMHRDSKLHMLISIAINVQPSHSFLRIQCNQCAACSLCRPDEISNKLLSTNKCSLFTVPNDSSLVEEFALHYVHDCCFSF